MVKRYIIIGSFILLLGIFGAFFIPNVSAIICNPSIAGGCPSTSSGSTSSNITYNNNTFINQTILGQNQTPWLSDIDAGGFNLFNTGILKGMILGLPYNSIDLNNHVLFFNSETPALDYSGQTGQGVKFNDAYYLPTVTGNANDILTSNGDGTTSWNPFSGISWADATNGTLALNSSLALYYPLSNPYSYYNSTTLPSSGGNPFDTLWNGFKLLWTNGANTSNASISFNDSTKEFNISISPIQINQTTTNCTGTNSSGGLDPEFSTGLYSYYIMNESAGTTLNDYSGNAFTGTYSGSGWTYGQTYGSQYGALNDGSATADGTAPNGATSWSTNVWYQMPSSTSFVGTLWNIGSGSTCGGYTRAINIAGTWYWDRCSSYMTSTTGIDNNVHMMTTTFDGSNMSAYIDGVLVNSFTTTVTLASATFNVGYDSSGSWNGYMSEMALWNNTILNSTQITDLYNSGNGRSLINSGSNPIFNDTIAYYKLDESSGSVAEDFSGFGNNATNNGATIGVPGKINTAYSFGGASDNKLVIPSADNVIPGNADFSIAVWANVTSGTMNNVLSWYSGGSPTQIFFTDTDIVLYSAVGGGYIISNPHGVTTTNEWHYYTWTRNGNDWHTYVDGVEVGTPVTNAFDIGTATGDFYVGTEGTGTDQWYNGLFDEIGIWNRSLNDTEISELYNAGAGLPFNSGGGTNCTNTTTTTTVNATHNILYDNGNGTIKIGDNTSNVIVNNLTIGDPFTFYTNGHDLLISNGTNNIFNFSNVGGGSSGISWSEATNGTLYPSSNPNNYISSVDWSSITGSQSSIALSGFNNDLGNYGGFLTDIAGQSLASANNDAGFIADAPADSTTYGRNNNAWTSIPSPLWNEASGFITPINESDIIKSSWTPDGFSAYLDANNSKVGVQHGMGLASFSTNDNGDFIITSSSGLVDAQTNNIQTTGYVNASSGFGVGANAGLTQNNYILKDVDLIELSKTYCWENFTGGILTASDC